MSNIAAVPGTAQARERTSKTWQKRKLWKEQFGSPARREWPQGANSGQASDADRGRFAAGLAVASRPLLIASCLSHWV